MNHKIGSKCKFENFSYPLLSFNAQSVKNKKIKIESVIDSLKYIPIFMHNGNLAIKNRFRGFFYHILINIQSIKVAEPKVGELL